MCAHFAEFCVSIDAFGQFLAPVSLLNHTKTKMLYRTHRCCTLLPNCQTCSRRGGKASTLPHSLFLSLSFSSSLSLSLHGLTNRPDGREPNFITTAVSRSRRGAYFLQQPTASYDDPFGVKETDSTGAQNEWQH